MFVWQDGTFLGRLTFRHTRNSYVPEYLHAPLVKPNVFGASSL